MAEENLLEKCNKYVSVEVTLGKNWMRNRRLNFLLSEYTDKTQKSSNILSLKKLSRGQELN